MTDILDLIDSAISDHSVSADAMRCSPDAPAAVVPVLGSMTTFQANWPAVAAAIRESAGSIQALGERFAAGREMWPVSESGTYHFASCQEPHLFRDCGDVCRSTSDVFVAEPGTYQQITLMSSGGYVTPPDDVAEIPWDHE